MFVIILFSVNVYKYSDLNIASYFCNIKYFLFTSCALRYKLLNTKVGNLETESTMFRNPWRSVKIQTVEHQGGKFGD